MNNYFFFIFIQLQKIFPELYLKKHWNFDYYQRVLLRIPYIIYHILYMYKLELVFLNCEFPYKIIYVRGIIQHITVF